MKVLINGGPKTHGMVTSLPSTRFARTVKTTKSRPAASAGRTATRRVAAGRRTTRKESLMPSTYRARRRSRAFHTTRANPRRRRRTTSHRRRNTATLPIHRSSLGTWVSDRGSTARTIVLKTGSTRRRRKSSKPKRTSSRRRKTTATTRRRRAPKRTTSRRRKASSRRSNPRRRRRTHARRHSRRSNPRRRRSHARRHRRRNPDFAGSLGTVGKTLGILGGLSVSFGMPKLLGMYVHPAFQRGFGGVATSFVSGYAASWLVGKANRTAGKYVWLGSLAGTILLGISALSASARSTVFPVEEALLAASLPTMGPSASAPSTSSALAQSLMNSGISAAQLQSMGLSDYIRPGALSNKRGVGDYFGPGAKTGYFQKAEKF